MHAIGHEFYSSFLLQKKDARSHTRWKCVLHLVYYFSHCNFDNLHFSQYFYFCSVSVVILLCMYNFPRISVSEIAEIKKQILALHTIELKVALLLVKIYILQFCTVDTNIIHQFRPVCLQTINYFDSRIWTFINNEKTGVRYVFGPFCGFSGFLRVRMHACIANSNLSGSGESVSGMHPVHLHTLNMVRRNG